MNDPAALLARLEAIGRCLEASGHALALIGLGSVGLETDCLDSYSDLDFFAVVESGHKPAYLQNLHWLSDVCPLAFHFANTVDGYKVLFADGIFAEFAVFEPAELQQIPFAPGRVVWKQPDVAESIARPAIPAPDPEQRDPQWLAGEALTNLLIGLARDRRGERLSACRFIQGYAVDRVLELVDRLEPSRRPHRDGFAPERRFEARYPDLAGHLQAWLPGYEHNRAAALAILAFLEQRMPVNAALADAIRAAGA